MLLNSYHYILLEFHYPKRLFCDNREALAIEFTDKLFTDEPSTPASNRITDCNRVCGEATMKIFLD